MAEAAILPGHAAPLLGPRHGHARRPDAGMSPSGPMALADLSARRPRRHGDPIEILLAAARPFDDGFGPLRPLWAQEATHRALSMLRLLSAPHRRNRGRPSPPTIYERRLALHLAAELRALETVGTTGALPCSGPLREIARDLVALFGPAVGQVTLDTDVAAFGLPGYRRRALVLLASELVTNALTHAFHGRGEGRISLRLQRAGRDWVRLQVGDDGTGYARGRPAPGRSVTGALTDLLQGEIRYCDLAGWGSTAEVSVPIAS